MFEFIRAKPRAFSFGSFGVVFVLPLLSAHVAAAQQACGDSVCPKGFTCETGEVACPEIACEGADCKPCTPSTYSSCRPVACQADSECADGMVCATLTEQECSGGGAEPCAGGDCPKAETETCTSTVTHECVPRWTLPCTSAADCGAGFTCEEQQECSCSGSGGGSTPGSSGSSGSSQSSSESCSCQPSGEKACKVVEVACTSDAACASGFTCEANPSKACSSSSDGSSSCEPVDPAKVCTPPYTDLPGGGFATRGGSDAKGESSEPSSVDDAGFVRPVRNGCSVTRVGGTGSAAPFLLALGAAVTLSRRRRGR